MTCCQSTIRSSHFCSNDTLLTRVSRQGIVVSFASLLRRNFLMVRKGCSAIATPSGWYNVVRGPRPPSVQWPRYQQWRAPSGVILFSDPESPRSRRVPPRSAGGSEATLCRGIPTKCRPLHVRGSNDWREFGNSWRRRFRRNSWVASRTEGSPPRGSGPSSGSPSRGMPSIHSTFAEEVGASAGGTGQRTAAVGHRSGAHGKISRGDGQGDRASSHCWWCPGGPHAHTAREDPRVGRRVGSIEGSRGRDGDRARGGSEETFTVSVSAFTGFGWWRCVAARVGCFARSACWPAPGCAHGDFDQSWKHSGSVESIQPVGVTQGHTRHTHRTRAKYCLRGVRVGEAKNPGPHRRRRRRVPSEGSESGLPGVVHHDLTLVDSSDDDAPFVVPRSTGPKSVPRVDDGIVHDPPSESDTESVEFRPRRRRLVLCSQSGSLPPPDEAGSREGITEMVAADTTDPVPDPLFVPMAGAMAFWIAEFGHCRSRPCV